MLCVECEEKRWRGQLKRTQTHADRAIPHTVTAKKEGRSLRGGCTGERKAGSAFKSMSVQAANPTIPAASIKLVTE